VVSSVLHHRPSASNLPRAAVMRDIDGAIDELCGDNRHSHRPQIRDPLIGECLFDASYW
jgi:hypothetical protein